MSALHRLGVPSTSARERAAFDEFHAGDHRSADLHLVVPDLAAPAHVAAARALVSIAGQLGLRPRIATSLGDPNRVAEAAGVAAADHALGVITVMVPPPPSLILEVPSVLVGDGTPRHPYVQYDPAATARVLADHLTVEGHTHVLVVATHSRLGAAEPPEIRAWRTTSIPTVTIESIEADHPWLDRLLSGGREVPFTAVVVDNDDIAILLEGRVSGARGGQLPVVNGFNSDGTHRTLTTVDHQMHERIADAVGILRGLPPSTPHPPLLRIAAS